MDVGAFYRAHREEVDAAVSEVLASGWYVLGAEVVAFEKEFAEALGLRSAVGVASGTDALVLALRALGVGPGDRVATVSHTAVATVAAIELTGARPVFVDIDPRSYTMDPDDLERALSGVERAKAVVVVHLYGHPADMPAILAAAERHGASVVEDCAQAHGARIGERGVGGFGAAAAFSFYPTKNLGAFGDAGAVSSPDPTVIERVLSLRQYGWKQRYVSEIPGMNSRLDELQAAILRVRLRHLAAENERRRALAAAYRCGLAGLDLILPQDPNGATHVYHQFVIRVRERDRMIDHLKRAGVGVNVHYPQPVHVQPAYRGRFEAGPRGLAVTLEVANSVLSLPMYPQLDDDAVARVVAAVRAALS